MPAIGQHTIRRHCRPLMTAQKLALPLGAISSLQLLSLLSPAQALTMSLSLTANPQVLRTLCPPQ